MSVGQVTLDHLSLKLEDFKTIENLKICKSVCKIIIIKERLQKVEKKEKTHQLIAGMCTAREHELKGKAQYS
jgi:hypothetical protein